MFKPFQGTQQTGNYNTTDKVNTGEKLFHTLFWRLLNAADEGPVSITKTEDGKAYWVSYEFSHAVTMFVWAAYQIVIAIVLVNLLIAMMCNTFAEVWKNADKKWKYSRTYYQAQFLPDKATFPPPFQWIFYLSVFVFNYKGGVRKKTEREKRAYFKLLKKLIQ